jgi:hypothetical protein
VTELPSSAAGDASLLPNESRLADRLLRRGRSPGLVDSGAVKAEVMRKLGWSDQLFPLLQRLLARAADGGAGGFVGGALPLAAPFVFGADDPVVTPLAASTASQVTPPSPPLSAVGAPQHLVRVSRRRRLPDTAPILPIANAASPQPSAGGAHAVLAASFASAVTTAVGPTLSPAVSRENSVVAASPEVPRRAAETRGGGGDTAARDAALVLDGSPVPQIGAVGSPNRISNQSSLAVSRTTRLPGAAGDLTLAPAAPTAAAAVGALPRVRELGVLGAGRGAAARVLSPGAALSPAASANQAPTARTILVSELRPPAVPGRPEIWTNEAPMARATVVPELSGPARPEARLVLPAAFAEAPPRVNGLRPAVSVAAEPPSRGRGPVEPNPAVTVVPRPAVPPAAALGGAELERLADKVSRMIARRVAVERERRGR